MTALQGYLKKEMIGRSAKLGLTNWKGKSLHYTLHRVVSTYSPAPEYDTTQAVILVKIGKNLNKVTYAAGYSLGEGMLFRGSVVGSAKWGSRQEADLVEEAENVATSESDYWMQRDQEAAEEDEAKMREEEETYGRDPRRRKRRVKRRAR